MTAPTTTKGRRDLRKAKVQVMLKHKFYATLAAHLPCIAKPPEWFLAMGAPPTACVDGKRLYFCPEFVESLTDKQSIGLLVHECLHCALGHLWRRGNRDVALWLMATDYVVNGVIMTSVDDKGNRIFELPPNGLYDPRFNGMSAERVYTILKREQQQGQRDDQGQPVAGRGQGGKTLDGQLEKPLPDSEADDGEGGGQDQQEGDGEGGQDGEGGNAGQPDQGDGHGPDCGHIEIKDDDGALEQRWRNIAQQAAIHAKRHGTLPGQLDDLIEEFTNPQIPWQRIVEQLANEVQREDYDWKRPERRFIADEIYAPDLYNPATFVAVFADTSGSISHGELVAFGSEINGILKSQGIVGIRYMACDARVQMDVTLSKYDDPPKQFPGRGGTDFRPPFERLKADPGIKRPSLIVYLTDLEGPFPTEDPGVPVLWIVSNEYRTIEELPQPPFGTVIPYTPLTDDPYGNKRAA